MVLAGAMASDAEVELTKDEKTVMEIIMPIEPNDVATALRLKNAETEQKHNNSENNE